MRKITQKELIQNEGCSKYLLKKIKNHALSSFFRLNAKTADCYAFDILKNDWCGGWDWSTMLVDSEAKYLFMLKDKTFYLA